jgi:hypothetical protein
MRRTDFATVHAVRRIDWSNARARTLEGHELFAYIGVRHNRDVLHLIFSRTRDAFKTRKRLRELGYRVTVQKGKGPRLRF